MSESMQHLSTSKPLVQPKVGDEEINLIPPKRRGGQFIIARRVWTNLGHRTVYDPALGDFVTWSGSWQTVEVLGQFPSRLKAREFMRRRVEDEMKAQGDD